MAYSFVQQASAILTGSAGPSVSVSLSGIAAGDTLIVAGTAGTIATITISDTAGNTWSPQYFFNAAAPYLSAWVCQNAKAGATTVTLNCGSTQWMTIYAAEYAGLATSGGVLATANATQAGPGTGANAISSGPALLSVPAMLWGLTLTQNTVTASMVAAGTAFTLRADTIWANGQTVTGASSEDLGVFFGGSYSATFTANAGGSAFDTFNTAMLALAIGSSPAPPGLGFIYTRRRLSRGPVPVGGAAPTSQVQDDPNGNAVLDETGASITSG